MKRIKRKQHSSAHSENTSLRECYLTLMNTPMTFQSVMDNLFAGMEDRVLAYIDDLAIFSKTWKIHKIHLHEVLNIIKKDGLTLQGDKCLIGTDSCEFLTYKVGDGMIEPTREKVTAILDFPRPKTKKDVRAWLGLTGYYHRLIPNYAARTILTSDLLPPTTRHHSS